MNTNLTSRTKMGRRAHESLNLGITYFKLLHNNQKLAFPSSA